MSKACPLGLNYGHFGEPSYDSENHKWHFPRQPGRTRELKLIGQPVRALQSLVCAPTAHVQSATERTRNIKDLTNQYPELLPASSLLPGLAKVSEVVDDVTSSHDSARSKLLAIGEAVDSDSKSRGLKTLSIAAVAGGAAGEAVRLVLLTKHKLGWEGSKNIQLSTYSSKGGEEGWWYGNGSPIQQLVFAEAQGRPSSWLAVRHHGAISVLRPELQRDPSIFPLAQAPSIRNTPSRLNANHIVTLSIGQAHNVPFSDVAFNPWYNQQIATIDQEGAWAVWDIEKVEKQAKGKRFWTVKRTRLGRLLDGLPEGETSTSSLLDGWGAVLWAGDLSTIIVASRRMLAVFDITGSPRRLSAPNLVSTTTAEWILDVKRSPKDSTHVFVTTTCSIFWLQITSSAGAHNSEEATAGAKCLLSWCHFRDPADISLGLEVADDSEREDVDDDRTTTLVLLYSRLTGLTNVFTFHYATSYSSLAPSASDPYLLPLPNDGSDVSTSRANTNIPHRSSKISAMVLKLVRFQSPQGSVPSGLGQIYSENVLAFYQLNLLTNNLDLLECLYAEVPTAFKAELHPPKIISRLAIAKTPAHVFDDFIVSNGYVDRDVEDIPDSPAKEEADAESRASLAVLRQDPYTISFEWLEHEIHEALNRMSPAMEFDENLNSLQIIIEDKIASGVPTVDTLLHMIDARVPVSDLYKASVDFVDFLDDMKRLTSENEDAKKNDEGRRLTVASILTPTLQAGLGFHDTSVLSSVYETLLQTWLVPMSRQIPGRVRIALEKTLRDMAGQLCLASYAMRVEVGSGGNEEKDQSENWEAGAQFVLPVRRRTSATSLGKGKERLDAVPSTPPVSSQISEDAGVMSSSAVAALPTPEPTPSLRSRSSVSSLASSEDPASQRLRAYASLTPQPALPAKLSNLLGAWQVGGDPANYDWEAAHQAAVTEDESEDESQKMQRERAKKKQKKKQTESAIESSSQPTSNRLAASQPRRAQDTQDVQQASSSSQQQTERTVAVTMSQVEPGKFGGRHGHAKVNKKLKDRPPRPAGFK